MALIYLSDLIPILISWVMFSMLAMAHRVLLPAKYSTFLQFKEEEDVNKTMVPYSQIPLNIQMAAIHAFESGLSPERILADQCFIDENNLKAVIRAYRLHWKERLHSVGRSFSDWSSLISGCFSHFSRQFMQIKTTVNKLFLLPT